MMGMCLTYSLLNQEDAILMQNSINKEQLQPLPLPAKKNATLPITEGPNMEVQKLPEIQNSKSLVPLDSAITPYHPAKNNEDTDFDLMALLADVENEIPDDKLVLAATQCEEASFGQSNKMAPISTTTTTVMKRISHPAPTFTNCSFGNIGTLNIHIHKN